MVTTARIEQPETLTRIEAEAQICRASFYAFVVRFWDIVVPEDPVWNFHIRVICEEMQRIAERVFRGEPKEHDLLINVPPGSTKSTICSIMFPAWAWTRMPTARLICASYSYHLAMDLSRKSRDVVQSDKYQELFDDLRLREDQNTKGYFINQHGGYRYTTSTGGTVTGFHGHFIVVDDPLNPQEAVSDADLRTSNNWIGRTLSTRKVDKRVTPTCLIMQRLHEDDPSAKMKEAHQTGKQQVRHINLPAEVDSSNRKKVRPRHLLRQYTPDPSKPGTKLLDPQRIPRSVLEEFKADNVLGEYGYAGQMLQEPTPLGGGMFKTERIEIIPERPARSKFRILVRFWDKAGTEGGGAFTVGWLMGELREGGYVILDVIRAQLDTWAREAVIKQTAQMDGVDVIIGIEQEPGSGGKESAEGSVRRLSGYIVEVVRPTGDKTIRAIPFSSQVNSGNVSMVEGEWNRDCINEMKMFPRSKFKDQVDAGSGAFTVLTGPTKRAGLW